MQRGRTSKTRAASAPSAGAKNDDSVLPAAASAAAAAASAAPASLQALFPTGLFDSSDSDESLLTCLPIGHVTNKCAEFRNNRLVHYRFVVHPHLLLKALDCRVTTTTRATMDSTRGTKRSQRGVRGRMTEEKREPRSW